jgi:hypothetical protein
LLLEAKTELTHLRSTIGSVEQAIDNIIEGKHPAFPWGWIDNLNRAHQRVIYPLAQANGACTVRGKDPKTYRE